jgi:hypothetical protein
VSDDGDQIGYAALPRGVPVHVADGPQVGSVHKVLDNAREHIFDGIVISTPSGRRFVDAPEVARIAERRVTLSITAAQAAELPHTRGMRDRVESAALRSARRWRRRLGG